MENEKGKKKLFVEGLIAVGDDKVDTFTIMSSHIIFSFSLVNFLFTITFNKI